MTVIFARIVACEQDVEASDVNEKHGCTKDMAGWNWCETDGGDGMSGVVVYCFYLRECREMICFGVESCTLVRRRGERSERETVSGGVLYEYERRERTVRGRCLV